MSVGNVSGGKLDPVIQARIDFSLKCLDGCGLSTEQMTAIQAIIATVPTQASPQMREESAAVNPLKRPCEDHSEDPALKRIKTSPIVSIEQHGPFLSIDIFPYVSQYLQKAQIGRIARTCQLWNLLSQNPLIWKQMTINEGVPFVKSKKQRDYRADLKLLGPMTITGKMIGECLGEVVGNIPLLSKRWFHNLNKPYNYMGGDLSCKERRALVVIPAFLKRTFSNRFPYGLDDKGNLTPAFQCKNLIEGKELIIPFKRENLKVLFLHPLGRHKNLSLVCHYLHAAPIVYPIECSRDGKRFLLPVETELFLVAFDMFPPARLIKWTREYNLFESSNRDPITINDVSDDSEDESSDVDDEYYVRTPISSDSEEESLMLKIRESRARAL